MQGLADLQGLPGALWSEAKEAVKPRACACPHPSMQCPLEPHSGEGRPTRMKPGQTHILGKGPGRNHASSRASSLLSAEGHLPRARQGVRPDTDQPLFLRVTPLGQERGGRHCQHPGPHPQAPVPATDGEGGHRAYAFTPDPADARRRPTCAGLEGTLCPEPRGPGKLPSPPPCQRQTSLTHDSHRALVHTESAWGGSRSGPSRNESPAQAGGPLRPGDRTKAATPGGRKGP